MYQVIDWLNENELRAFPLLYNGTLPSDFLLDLQLIFKSHDIELSPIFLKSYRKVSNDLELVFGSLNENIFTFTLPSPDTQTYPYYLRAANGCLVVFGEGAKTIFSSATSTAAVVELPTDPSVCYQFNNAWLGVSSIACTPNKQTRTNSHAPILPLIPATSAPLVGDITFLAGYNFRVNINDNAIDLEIGGGYGLKMDCSTFFLEETFRDCSDIVSYINGVPPDEQGNFRLLQGADINIVPGTTLTADFDDRFQQKANEHSLFVGLSFQQNDVCAPVNLTPSLL
jgi:hypothetical protein